MTDTPREGSATESPPSESPSSTASTADVASAPADVEQFRLLAEEVEEYAIFFLDTEGHVTSWNPGAEKIKGYTEEEIVGQHFSIFYPEEEAEAGRPEEGLQAAIRTGDWTDEGWRIRRDGSRFWARVTITALTGDDDRLRGFAKVTRDLTERRRGEQALRESERRYRRLFEESRDAVVLTTPDGAIVDANAAAAELFGYTQDELLSLNAAALYADPMERATRIVPELKEATSSRVLEARMQHREGHTFWASASVTLHHDESGHPDLIQALVRDITERKRREEELRKREERYRRLFEEAQEGIAISTPEGEIEKVNPAAADIFGLSREELLQKNTAELYVDPTEQEEITQELGEKGSLREREVHLRRADGAEIVCQVSTTVHRKREGRPVAFQTFFRDVTDRRRAIEALKDSEEKFRKLAEEAPLGVALIQDGAFQYVNPAYSNIVGYKEQELVGASPEMVIHEDDWPAVQDQMRRRLDGETSSVAYRTRVRTKTGGIRTIEVNATKLLYRGKPTLLGTIKDITEWQNAQEALKESEEKFRALAEGALVGIVLIQEGVYAYVNPALSEMTGYPREHLVGGSPEQVVHPADWPTTRDRLQRLLEGEIDEVRAEARLQRKEGQTRHVRMAGARITYRGKPAAIATVEDITERRRLQREILQVQEEERRRIGQELHDGAASELTGAKMRLDLLSKKVDEGEVADDVEEVSAIVERTAEDVRRLSHGLNPAGLSEGDLAAALKSLANRTDRATFENRLRDEAVSVEGACRDDDSINQETATHLYRIAQEAAANARRHGEADEIVIRLRRENSALVLEVEDDGRGFDPSEVSEDGVGLRSMRHRTEVMGAELEVDSTPGAGTCVRCRLSG